MLPKGARSETPGRPRAGTSGKGRRRSGSVSAARRLRNLSHLGELLKLSVSLPRMSEATEDPSPRVAVRNEPMNMENLAQCLAGGEDTPPASPTCPHGCHHTEAAATHWVTTSRGHRPARHTWRAPGQVSKSKTRRSLACPSSRTAASWEGVRVSNTGNHRSRARLHPASVS